MRNTLMGRDIINLRDLTPGEFRYLINLSSEMKKQKMAGVDQRKYFNKNVVASFEWSSTRTRCAFQTACHDLGMGFTYLTNSHMGKSETLKDTIRVLSGMYDAIVIRAQKPEAFLYDAAKVSSVPIINALSLGDHPTQMLADALTMEEQWGGLGSSKHKKMAFVGNCGGAPLYYGRLCALLGMDFYAIGPDNIRHQMAKAHVKDIQAMFDKWAPNNKFIQSSDLNLLKGVDVIVTEEWRYLNPDAGQEVMDPNSYDSFMGDVDMLLPYRVSSEIMERTENPDIFCMHELPSIHNADHSIGERLLSQAPNERERKIIEEGLEITDECFEKNASVIFREAENRQHTIKAILSAVMGA